MNLDGTSDGALTIGCAGSDHTLLRVRAPRRARARGHRRPTHRALRRAGRPLGRRHRRRPRERDQGARPRARRRVRGSSVRARLARRRRQPKRDPARRRAVLCLPAELEDALRARPRPSWQPSSGSTQARTTASMLDVSEAEAGGAADADTTRRALDLVAAIPTGVLAITPGLVEVVETSTSLTTAASESGVLTLGSMTRSSNAAALDGVLGDDARARTARRRGDRGAPLVSTVGAQAGLRASRNREGHPRARVRRGAHAHRRPRRARVRRARPASCPASR